MEGANINRSLLALGNCINALGERGNKGQFVPYRYVESSAVGAHVGTSVYVTKVPVLQEERLYPHCHRMTAKSLRAIDGEGRGGSLQQQKMSPDLGLSRKAMLKTSSRRGGQITPCVVRTSPWKLSRQGTCSFNPR